MKVVMCKLDTQYTKYKKEIDSAIKKVIDNTAFIMGKPVSDFEEHLVKYTGAKHALGCSSGTMAVVLALRALDIGKGDEVITTPFTFIATASSIAHVGAKAVFADIDEKTFNLDVKSIEKKITKKTKAIVVVHLFGQSANMEAIMKLARKHKLKVIEDNAQTLGAYYKGKRCGVIGDIGTLSFFPAKTLGGFGDGGALLTNKKTLAEKIKVLRLHGSRKTYSYDIIGYNSRLDALQAAILNVKLKYLDKFNNGRRKAAAYYDKKLAKISQIVTPFIDDKGHHIYGQYVLKVKNRDKLQKHLLDNGCACAVYYPYPLHLQPCFADLQYKKGSLPVSEKMCKDVLALPISPDITRKEQDIVIKLICEFYGV